MVSLTNCATLNEPIIINNIPTVELSDDMTLESYLKNTAGLIVDLKTYIDELINQITHKIKNYVDLREKTK